MKTIEKNLRAAIRWVRLLAALAVAIQVLLNASGELYHAPPVSPSHTAVIRDAS